LKVPSVCQTTCPSLALSTVTPPPATYPGWVTSLSPEPDQPTIFRSATRPTRCGTPLSAYSSISVGTGCDLRPSPGDLARRGPEINSTPLASPGMVASLFSLQEPMRSACGRPGQFPC
jgi:hypothetical protein